MTNSISRRRFLVGSMALAGGSLFGCGETTTATQQEAYRVADASSVAKKVPYYPPALLGLRGNHEGAQMNAHSVAWGGKQYTLADKTEEEYDLIVVGAGISGLAAAYRYWKERPQAKILILENHDDFGGHARRNEFTVNGKTLITYGGSESLEVPSEYADLVKNFLRDLGVDYQKFHQYFQKDLYTKQWGLKEGVFFNQAAFGKTLIAPNIPSYGDAAAVQAVIAQYPMSAADQKALLDLFVAPKDYWAGKPSAAREMWAVSTSYWDFLKDTVKLGEMPLNFLKNISSEYWGHAANGISVSEAWADGYPGLGRLKLTGEKNTHEAFIYHFPDGNASIVRMLLRKLIPAVASGSSMEDIVTAQFHYEMLDKPEHNVRLRLNSTAVRIENNDKGTAVAYLKRDDTQIHQAQAKHTVFAGFSTIAPHIISNMPEAQKTAMKTSVRIPMIYAKVALKNAKAWQKMGVYKLYAPAAPYCVISLDDPVNIGDYRPNTDVNEPIILHTVRIATDWEGKDVREMYRNGRRKLMAQDYAALEQELFAQLREIYGTVGENFDDVVAGVIINRWAHGYAYEQAALFDSEEEAAETNDIMRKPVGKIHMANSDVAWMPYFNNAVEEGYRAVEEILKG